MATLETNCNFISFPCHSYDAYETGLCVDCDNFKQKSCPRLGKRDCYNYCDSLWKMNNIIVLVFFVGSFHLFVNMLTFCRKTICGTTRENSSFPTKYF